MMSDQSVKTTYPQPFVTVREDKRPGGWSEIGVYVDPVLPGAGKILVAVISHPCTGAKWFVHPAGGGQRITCRTRYIALQNALLLAEESDAYKLHQRHGAK